METAAVAGATAVTAGCGTGTGAAVAQEIRIERMGRRTCERGKLQGIFDGIGLADLSRNKALLSEVGRLRQNQMNIRINLLGDKFIDFFVVKVVALPRLKNSLRHNSKAVVIDGGKVLRSRCSSLRKQDNVTKTLKNILGV
uniref:Uncharacterized protein n=1 Tax=Vespula pensylvanica TaxID=30213 RepID=A0A834UD91_VESPE|nr:hypothetical protein H0235_004701 [Vespula pensylvanica]